MEGKLNLWLILDLFVRIMTMIAVVIILAKSFQGIILSLFVILFISWAFRPVYLAFKNFKLPKKKSKKKKFDWNQRNFWISFLSLIVLVILSIGITIYQTPKPDISYQLYVNTETGTLDIYFFNTGERAVILSNLSVYEVGSDTLTLSNQGLPEMISPFSDVKLISTNEKIKENTDYIINYCYIWGEDSKCKKIGPRPLKNVYKFNIDLSITFADSVSISIIRVRNSSIVNFEEKSLNNYETICYIENTGGNPERYVIEDLNFSTPYISPYETFDFKCKIKNGKVNKII